MLCESQLRVTKGTCEGRLKICKTDSHRTKSFQTSVQDSIGKEKDCTPFWNKHTQELPMNLLSPIRTGCADLDLNSWDGFSKRLEQNSWFSVQIHASRQTQPWNLSQDLLSITTVFVARHTGLRAATNKRKRLRNETDERQTSAILNKDNQAFETRKNKLYPSAHQKKVLKEWFSIACWTHNKCLNEIKEDGLLSKKELRARNLNEANFKETKLEWVLNTPYDIRDEGLNDLLKAYKSNFAKGKNQKFTIKKRSKKQASQSIVIHAKHWLHKMGIYWDMFGKGNAIRSALAASEDIKYDTPVTINKIERILLMFAASSGNEV